MTMIIEVKDLVKTYGRKRALDNVSFTLNAGSPIALVGPNGAGKTTLFSTLCGYLNADSGSVSIFGHKPGSDGLFGRLAALPQDAQLDPRFSVSNQLCLYGQLQGLDKKTAENETHRVLELVDLKDCFHSKPHELSHGMRKRICIAQTLLSRPEVVLLDEATAGLDPVNAREIRNLVRTLQSDTTFILSSHDLVELDDLCDQVLHLQQGKLTAVDRIAQAELATLTVKLKETGTYGHVEQLKTLQGVENVSLNASGAILIEYRSGQQVDIDVLQLCRAQGWHYKSLVNGKTLEDELFG
ncbi:ABC transporter ATP-binding protein [Pseudoalteromonas sp. McH1-7]|uniref:ABC transporter ATP-binding protein n=1 Tax=Pseudoalteromonas TaxID=53246 RepID=UPI001591499E|nr:MULTISPECIES: ABC transporter ATP-binding protein [Pseudoalteromonas]MDW7549888.1 ABC transporter ATP-binding protein [Pseudoalteromonas peptidolytica]NUZ09428.1 ABC transporter ATP-binding protein [Pseudoalteromonas sp. McH1-7]USD29778.1 ABC transporter ATP-binding protein [Pseudoalteromonas sp. SCSIO 43201]